MKHVSILIPEGHTSLVNIAGTHQILNQVNDLCIRMGKEGVFEVQLVGLSQKPGRIPGCLLFIPIV
jgi:hypothetical protein